jgi:hypothetical protein
LAKGGLTHDDGVAYEHAKQSLAKLCTFARQHAEAQVNGENGYSVSS